MALVFFDGFEHYAWADVTKKWSGIINTDDNTSFVTGRRGSGQALQMVATYAHPSKSLFHTLAATRTSGVAGFAFKISTFPTNVGVLFGLSSAGGSQAWFSIDGSGGISFNRSGNQNFWGSSSTVVGGPFTSASIQLNVWMYLEFKWTIGDGTGYMEVRVNGATIGSASNLDNRLDTNPTGYNAVYLAPNVTPLSGGTVTMAFDDIYVLDDQAGLTDFLGDVRVDAHYANANGTTSQWARSAGADQFATIDEAQANGDTDYNSTAVVGNKDTLNVENFKNPGGTIYGVQTNLWAKKSDAGAGAISPVVRTGGVDRDGTSVPLGTDYADSRQVYETDPATSVAWVEADFNGAEFGYKKRA